MNLIRSVAFLAALALSVVSIQAQVTHRVPADFPTIQGAIDSALAGDTVLVAPGVYLEHDISFRGKALAVIGEAGAAFTTVDAGGLGRVFVFDQGEGPSSFLSGFTITGGSAPDGAAISGGGGILCSLASPTIAACAIVDNEAGDGNFSPGGPGGGLYLRNSASYVGSCVIARNTTGRGSVYQGLHPTFGFPILITELDGDGGGVAVERSTAFGPVPTTGAALIHCTIVGNHTNPSGPTTTGFHAGRGAGVSSYQIGFLGSEAFANGTVIANSIIYGNTPALIVPASFPIPFPNAVRGGTAIHAIVEGGLVGEQILDVDPRLVDASANHGRLRAGSPAVDAGSVAATGAIAIDVGGQPRIFGGGPDLGAAEQVCLPGSSEDLALDLFLNGAIDPAGCRPDLAVGDAVTWSVSSPGASFVGGIVVVGVQVYGLAFPPMTPPAFPEVHVDPLNVLIVTTTGLLPAGLSATVIVPAGLGGFTARLQAFVPAPAADNGIFAASPAPELVLP